MSVTPNVPPKLNDLGLNSNALWSGRLGGVTDHHSDQQLTHGFLPFRHRRGSCEIRGRGANLWYAAAKALGFDVATIRCPDSAFVAQLSSFVRV